MAALNKRIFSKKSGCRSSASLKILAHCSHCSAKFQPILDCFITDSVFKYEDSQNIKTDRANTVVFNLHQIKRRVFLGDTRHMLTRTEGILSPELPQLMLYYTV